MGQQESGSHLSVYMNFFGQAGTICWFEDFENLAAVETRVQQIMTDQEYLHRFSQLPILFIGRGFDTVMAAL